MTDDPVRRLQKALKNNDDEAGVQAAGDIARLILGDLGRVATALERIATELEGDQGDEEPFGCSCHDDKPDG